MIDKEYGEYILVCDVCGREVNGFESWQDAVDGKRESGFVSRKINNHWEDWCHSCKNKK